MEIRGHGGITHFGNSEGKGGSNMEAVRGMVRIFSGIAESWFYPGKIHWHT